MFAKTFFLTTVAAVYIMGGILIYGWLSTG
jgi:hypothetical protein